MSTQRFVPLARGFTLIELMYTLGISGILGAGFLGAVLWQERLYTKRQSDAETRSQAQTVLLALKSAAERAGYGFGHANDAVGLPATGVCSHATSYATNWSATSLESACAKLDNGGKSDRLRLSFVDPWTYVYVAPSAPSAGPCSPGQSVDPSQLHLAEGGLRASSSTAPTSLASQLPLYIGGACQGGSPSAGTDALVLTNAAGQSGAGCTELRTFTRTLPSGPPATSLSCPTGYAPGYTLGLAEALEFYTDTDATSGLPRLMMAQLSWAQPPAQVAIGVTRFEVRYGFDTSSSRDNKLHPCATCTDDPWQGQLGGPYSWCREVRASDQGGSCALQDDAGTPLSTNDLRNRVVAVHVTFDIVSPQATSAVVRTLGLGTGAPTWTYQTTLFLPNAAL